MMSNPITARAAAALPVVGIVLALANWNVRPAVARPWATAIVMFLVMIALRQGFQLASRHSSRFMKFLKRMFGKSTHAHGHDAGDADAALRRDADVVKAALAKAISIVNSGVVFGALMMIVSLAMALAHAYGLVDDPKSGSRAIMVMSGVYLVMMGNGIPRLLPPVTLKPRVDAGVQSFHRSAGWTWVLCGLAFVAASLVLPANLAAPVSLALVGAAVIVTVIQFVRLVRNVRPQAPGLN